MTTKDKLRFLLKHFPYSRQFRHDHKFLRFINLVDVRKLSECWCWQGTTIKDGYGSWFWNREDKHIRLSHQAAYCYFIGPVPDGLCVRHRRCDNPPCCNPCHLKSGTQADNVRDMVKQSRQCHGARVHTSKLSIDTVNEIRKKHKQYLKEIDGKYQKNHKYNTYGLARRYKVNISTIRNIVLGLSWKL